MNPQVIICSTSLPNELEVCRNSLIGWSETNNYDVLEVGPPDYLYEFKYITSAFDLLRVELLAERPYRLWVDWDVLIKPGFSIPNLEKIAVSRDYILWNGLDTDWFKGVLNDYTNYCAGRSSAYIERYRMWKVMKQYRIQNFKEFDPDLYKHLYYSSRRKT